MLTDEQMDREFKSCMEGDEVLHRQFARRIEALTTERLREALVAHWDGNCDHGEVTDCFKAIRGSND